jgi:hypothetical protein
MRQFCENVFRQRVCGWRECGAIFWICRSCDRGHRYCSDRCRQKARREQLRAANLRYRQTLEARLDQRDRQRAYRLRLAKRSVMDQGSPGCPSSRKIVSPVHSRPVVAAEGSKSMKKTRMIHDHGIPCCIICGRRGFFVNPFHQRR